MLLGKKFLLSSLPVTECKSCCWLFQGTHTFNVRCDIHGTLVVHWSARKCLYTSPLSTETKLEKIGQMSGERLADPTVAVKHSDRNHSATRSYNETLLGTPIYFTNFLHASVAENLQDEILQPCNLTKMLVSITSGQTVYFLTMLEVV